MPIKYKKGDKVRVKHFDVRPNLWDQLGEMDYLMGKVVEVDSYTLDGHTLIIKDEQAPRGYWTVDESHVEPVNECIVIYRRDDFVVAVDKRTGEKGIAKCHPDDTFDFKVGAKLAFERLGTTEKANKVYNGKIIFTKGDDIFKTGHIYDVKDGYMIDPRPFSFIPHIPNQVPFTDLDDIKDYFTGEGNRKNRKIGWSIDTLEFIEVLDD